MITYNGVQLTSDDYSITSLRCSAGNEILGFSISYKQNYSGTRQMTSVKRCDLSDIPEQIFSGNAVTPKPTVKYGSATLQEGTDYVLSWADNTKTGTGSVTVTGINKYFASQTLTFKNIRSGTDSYANSETNQHSNSETNQHSGSSGCEINSAGNQGFHILEQLYTPLEPCKEFPELYSLQKNKFRKIRKDQNFKRKYYFIQRHKDHYRK